MVQTEGRYCVSLVKLWNPPFQTFLYYLYNINVSSNNAVQHGNERYCRKQHVETHGEWLHATRNVSLVYAISYPSTYAHIFYIDFISLKVFLSSRVAFSSSKSFVKLYYTIFIVNNGLWYRSWRHVHQRYFYLNNCKKQSNFFIFIYW